MSQVPVRPRLGFATKVNYGLGSIVQGVAGVALAQGVIVFFLNQVVHLRADLVGVLILVSLVIDAVLDPLIGRWSDNFRSRWGRRHPFMYASAVPIAAAIYLFWNPPAGLSDTALAAYVLGMLVVLRLCVSLYQIPSDALTPELAPDYHERTSLLSFRWFFGIFGAVAMTVLLYAVFLRKDATHPLGLYNRAGYSQFGLLAAVVVFVAILISTWSTHRYIPLLSQAPKRRQTMGEAAREMLAVVTNRSLMVVMLSGLISGVVTGMNNSLSNYFNTLLWGLTPQMIALLLVVGGAPASIVGLGLAPFLSRRLDKKRTMITVFVASIFTFNVPIALRLLGLMPPNSSIWVPAILTFDLFVGGALALIGLVIIGSMTADIAEDSAMKTGVRSEGVLFALNGLLPKITTGIGAFMAGEILTSVHIPSQAVPASMDPAIMRNLALISMPIGISLSLIATGVLVFYRIDKAAHERNLAQLAGAPTIGDDDPGDGDGMADAIITPLRSVT